jgi:hypothetical protein
MYKLRYIEFELNIKAQMPFFNILSSFSVVDFVF